MNGIAPIKYLVHTRREGNGAAHIIYTLAVKVSLDIRRRTGHTQSAEL